MTLRPFYEKRRNDLSKTYMNPFYLTPILLALLAYVGWGMADAISIKLYRKNSPATITFYSGVGRMIIWLLLIPFFWNEVHKITLVPFLFNIIAGLASGLGYYFFGKATRLTNPAIVAAFGGGWGATALLFSLVFFREYISPQQWIAISIVFVGLIITLLQKEWFRGTLFKNAKESIIICLPLFLWGICGATLKVPAVSYGFYWTSLIMLIPYAVIIFFDAQVNNEKIQLKIHPFFLFIIVVVMTILADLGYNASLSSGGLVAITGTLAGSYATLTTLLAYIFYKEPLSRQQKVGVIVSLIGIVLTAHFSSR